MIPQLEGCKVISKNVRICIIPVSIYTSSLKFPTPSIAILLRRRPWVVVRCGSSWLSRAILIMFIFIFITIYLLLDPGGNHRLRFKKALLYFFTDYLQTICTLIRIVNWSSSFHVPSGLGRRLGGSLGG